MNLIYICDKLKYMETVFDRIKRKKRRRLAESNFEINSKCDADPETTSENRLVDDQNGARGKAFVYGKYPARHNACEAIAVHNAKVLLGIPSTLSETIASFQLRRAMIFGGFFGSNVLKIGRILKHYGIPYKRFFRKKRLKDKGLFIISFWNDKPLKNGLHTVALESGKKEYKTYNLYGDGSVSGADPAKYAKRFIVGYYLGEAPGANKGDNCEKESI